MSNPEWLRGNIEHDDDFALGGCSHCGDGATGFWHDSDVEAYYEEARNFYDRIEFDRALKFGTLYRCKVNGCLWFMDFHRDEIRSISPIHRELILEWSSLKLQARSDQLRMLSDIGCTGGSEFDSDNYQRDFPCRCTMDNGDVLDYAIVRFSRTLPLWSPELRLAFINDVRTIELSTYALSLEIRETAFRAPEVRMMFYPTLVKAGDGQRFILNGACDFFHYRGLKGDDFSLTDTGWEDDTLLVDGQGQVFPYGEYEEASPPLPITLILADWEKPFAEPYPKKYMEGPGILDW